LRVHLNALSQYFFMKHNAASKCLLVGGSNPAEEKEHYKVLLVKCQHFKKPMVREGTKLLMIWVFSNNDIWVFSNNDPP
jgi:hypothetical protein